VPTRTAGPSDAEVDLLTPASPAHVGGAGVVAEEQDDQRTRPRSRGSAPRPLGHAHAGNVQVEGHSAPSRAARGASESSNFGRHAQRAVSSDSGRRCRGLAGVVQVRDRASSLPASAPVQPITASGTAAQDQEHSREHWPGWEYVNLDADDAEMNPPGRRWRGPPDASAPDAVVPLRQLDLCGPCAVVPGQRISSRARRTRCRSPRIDSCQLAPSAQPRLAAAQDCAHAGASAAGSDCSDLLGPARPDPPP